MPLILAFDTATDRATSALVGDGELLGERVSRASTLLADVDALVRQGGAHPRDVTAAGVSTLAALAAGAPGATAVIDAKRREVFVAGPRAIAPGELEIEAGATYVGDGAIRYRELFEQAG